MFQKWIVPAVCLLGASALQVYAQEDTPATSDRRWPSDIDERGALTLAEAVALALTRSPALAVYPWDIRAAEARAVQASLWPNPVLSFEAEDVRLSDGPDERTRGLSVNPSGLTVERTRSEGVPSGIEEAEFTFRISQVFLLGGKRKKAKAVADSERSAAEWDYEIGRTNVLRGVARAYVTVLASQDEVAERRQILDLAQTVEATIAARVDAGKVSSIEQKRASVQTTAARIELARSERQLAGARVELAATWGSLDPAFDHVTGELHTATALPSLNVLLERSAANPDLQRWQYEIARREAELDLAAARRIPDLTASLGFVTQGIEGRRSRSLGVAPNGPFFSQSSTRFDDSRDNRVEFEISIPLPIFDRNQGRIREAEYLRAKADDERHAAVVQVQSQITHWHETANVAYNEVAMLENLAIRDAKDAFEAMQIGFNEGKFGYLDVLDAQRTLFELESQLHDAYAAYHLAVVEVERLLGEPLWPAGEIFGTSIQENPDESN